MKATAISKELLDILCCPKCKGDLDYKPDQQTLTCKSCGQVYPVKDDIPIMLPEEAGRIGDTDPGEEGGSRG